MVRRGWQQLDVPTGWVQILRGPQPKAEKWPAASAEVQGSPSRRVPKRQSGSPQLSRGQPVYTQPPLRQVSKPPEKVAADAVGEIERLQAAIAALGDSTLVKPLQEALRVAQTRASVPIHERVDSCKLFLERAKKRVQRAQEVIDRVWEHKVLYEAEVVEGEERLAKLVAEAAASNHPQLLLHKSQSFRHGSMLSLTHCVPLKESLFQLQHWALGWVVVLPGSKTSHQFPLWMGYRNCELRDAIEFGDPMLGQRLVVCWGKVLQCSPR